MIEHCSNMFISYTVRHTGFLKFQLVKSRVENWQYNKVKIKSIVKEKKETIGKTGKNEISILIYPMVQNWKSDTYRAVVYGPRECFTAVPDLPIGSIGWSLGPQNLGGLRSRCIIFSTLLLDFHTYAVIVYCTFF